LSCGDQTISLSDITDASSVDGASVKCSATVADAGAGRVMPATNDALSRTRHELPLDDDTASDAAERLVMTEKLIKELNETWEEKIRKSEEIRRQRLVRL